MLFFSCALISIHTQLILQTLLLAKKLYTLTSDLHIYTKPHLVKWNLSK